MSDEVWQHFATRPVTSEVNVRKIRRYYADALFLIEDTWEGVPARLDRSLPKRSNWLSQSPRDRTSEAYAQFPTTHILFSSTFNDAVDGLLRKHLRTGKRTGVAHGDIEVNCELISESHRMYKRACWLPKALSASDATYYLLIFQVKNTSVFLPDDPRNFQRVEQRVQDLEPVSWGILLGGADGYVLYRADNARRSDRIRIDQLNKECKQTPSQDSFLSHTIPLLLHKLKLAWNQNVSELLKAIEFPDNFHWQDFIDSKMVDLPDDGDPVEVQTGSAAR